MNGQSVLRYGDTVLFNLLTRRFRQEPVNNDSGHHVMYVKTTIEVSGILTGKTAVQAFDHKMGRASGSPADSHKMLRTILFHPRRRLELRVDCAADGSGGTLLFAADPYLHPDDGGKPSDFGNPSGYDLNAGPVCTDLEITHVANNTTFRVSATFECFKRECDAHGSAGENQPIKSLTWSVTDDIDQNFTTSRTYVGRLLLNHANIDPNSLRGFCVPPVLPGLMRKQMTFAVGVDRMTLDFTITDKEVHMAPPAPATSWHVSHRVEAGEAAYRIATIEVALAGDRNAKKKELLNLALRVIDAKLFPPVQKNKEAAHFLENLVLVDEWGDDVSRVYASARVRYTFGDADPSKETAYITGVLGKPLDGNDLPGYDPVRSRGLRINDVGTEVEGPVPWKGAIVSAFRDACVRIKTLSELAPTLGTTRGKGETEAGSEAPEGAEVTFTEGASLADEPPGYMSPGHAAAMLTTWNMESLYDTDEGVLPLPIAASNVGSPGQSDAPAVVFARLHRPIAVRTVRVVAERLGYWPDLPIQVRHKDPNGIVVTPLRTKVLAKTTERTVDGKPLYRASVEYVQGLNRPIGPNDVMVSGYDPRTILGLEGVPPEALRTTLTDSVVEKGPLFGTA